MSSINTLAFPLRVVLDQDLVRHIGLKSLADERADQVLSHVKGRFLDIGCGENLLAKAKNGGVGVDVYPWKGVDVLCHTHHLPFPNRSFDTLTMLACLNHVPKPSRLKVLKEAHRVLKPKGRIILTMIDPRIGWVCHKLIATWDPDQTTRGIKTGEDWGLEQTEVFRLLKQAKFSKPRVSRFSFLNLNSLYISHKP